MAPPGILHSHWPAIRHQVQGWLSNQIQERMELQLAWPEQVL